LFAQQMGEIHGLASPAERPSRLEAFPLSVRILARQLVSLAQSFIQPTEAPAGLVNQAQRHSFRWRTFPSVIKTTERRLGMKEPSSEPQMGETLGLARQAARPTRFEAFLLPIRITGLLWVSLAQC